MKDSRDKSGMPKSPGVVIAGSPRFVNALIAPLAGQVGVWPDVAPDPRQALVLCGDAWLVVMELQGDEWRTLAHDLRALHDGSALGIVVVMPPGGGSARPVDGADEEVTWSGPPGPVLEAVQRLAMVREPAVAPAPPAPAPAIAQDSHETRETPEEATAPVAGAAPEFGAPGTWPGTVLSRSEAESVLAAAAVGLWPQEALRPLAERVVASLSDLEMAALRGDPLPVEPGPVCRAAALRWLVTDALERAPAPGSPVDGAVVQAMLGDIDGALAALKGIGEGAAPDVQPALETLRHALVKEAIDLTDVVHRIVPSEVVVAKAAPPAAPREARRPPRVITFGAGTEDGSGHGRRGLWIALAMAAAAGAAFHGYRYLARRPLPTPPTLSGAPEGTMGSIDRATGIATLTSTNERPPSPAAVEKFRTQEELKGRVVREMAPGVYLSEPAHRVEKADPPGSQRHP